ncbi:MAG: hypothetical protein KDK37_12035 [Leptospiraceae bacterium]|nr:hypothetical protein [Leptospiraceae bacterium]
MRTVSALFLLATAFLFPVCSASEQKTANQSRPAIALPQSEGLPTPSADPQWDRAARLIAGLEGGEYHRKSMDRLWARIEKQNIEPIRRWIQDKPYLRESNRPVFYPLSGADFINAHTFFPSAPYYLLIATEPPGKPQELLQLSQRSSEKGLTAVRSVITNIAGENYFQSRKMSQTMSNPELSGVLPVFLVWLARKDQEVLSVQSIAITESGDLIAGEGKHPGLRIRFRDRKAGSKEQTLYYFKIFLGPKSLQSAGGQPESRLLGQLEGVNTIMKAAVYLLHNEKYAPLAQSILSKSDLILQDDSGVPYRMFGEPWNLDLYGHFTKPVSLQGMLDPYKHLLQPDLARAYAKAKPQNLPFPYGYGILRGGMSESMLMLARKSR